MPLKGGLPEEKSGAERRESYRLTHAVTVRSRRFPGNRAIARDVSSTGIRVVGGGVSAKLAASPLLMKGEQFEIALDLDLIQQEITLPAEVMWVRHFDEKAEFEAGLRFIEVTEEKRRILAQYMGAVAESLRRFL